MTPHTTTDHAAIILQQVRHIRTADAFRAFARWAGVDSDSTDGAIDAIRSGSVVALLGSGAQGSGKDSVCPAVFDALAIEQRTQCRVAHGIRAEMADILQHIEHAPDPAAAQAAVAGALRLDDASSALYVELFFAATRDRDHGIDVHQRSERMRRALQWHGTEARADQPGYWVRRTYQDVIPHLARGTSVYLTDGRFPAEVDAGRTTGALCIRLFVPETTRIERIMQRDGFVPSEQTLRHPGEVALDGYWGLDAEIDNTCGLDETVAVVADLLERHRETLRNLQ
jgi:hypothetical protein